MVVLGFGGLFLCIVGAAVFQLRRAVRTDAKGGPDGPGNPETGVLDSVDSPGKP